MDAIGIDPRDETWEIRAPRYRVYFFDGTASDEFELGARNVVEALAWVKEHSGRRTYALYACVPIDGMGLVLLAGADPKDAEITAPRGQPFVSKLVLTSLGESTVAARVRALLPEPGDAPDRADVERMLGDALAPVLRDVRTAGVPEPGVDGYGWVNDPEVASVMLGGVSGLSIAVDSPTQSQVAVAADQVQEWVVEELWSSARSTNWPPCPHHRASHPLHSVVFDGVATWICPSDGTPISAIGSLPRLDED
ncbi:MAG: hypothetical protein ACOH2F_20325 [Cellulomonas sp.]